MGRSDSNVRRGRSACHVGRRYGFKIPQCVQKALHEYVDFGAIGYYRIPDGYYDAFINWEKKHFNFKVKREWLRFAPGVVAAFNWMIQMLTKKGMQ